MRVGSLQRWRSVCWDSSPCFPRCIRRIAQRQLIL